ncbi:hypothetical protein AQUSIP_19390 [Aquicella siphonis]|uniref:Uncharacterized protein n=1 Tax=Aquicella siphonis TaxID=254247 RepID=A0A5E4PK34_9COXI|nr:hypothetical protein [Aquicella siphonis]VVC76616.1 hypothetical protein AQUSIP_19390 [Aquicella siphonis]
MIWVYLVLSIWTIVIVYPFLRISSINRFASFLITVAAVAAVILLSAVFLKPHFMAWQHERYIRTQYPFVSYLETQSPVDFGAYMSQIRDNVKKNKNLNNEIYYQSELLNTLLLKYGPVASHKSLYDYLKQNVEYDKKLIKIDPVYVLYHEFPDKFIRSDINFDKLDRDEYIMESFNAVEPVIKSGVESPQKMPSDDEQKQAMVTFRKVVDDLSKKYGAKTVVETLQNPADTKLDKETSAKIIIAFFEEIIAKGEENAGLFMRVSYLVSRPKPAD